jgi:hypothetical protein
MEKLLTLNGMIMEDNQNYHVNFKHVANEKSLLAITRLLAMNLTKNPYMTIGDFIKNLSDGDLEEFVTIIDDGEHHTHFEDLMLISMMLSAAEGSDGKSLDTCTQNLNALTTFIICESLYRKGFVKIYHDNMSFGEDMKDKMIVEKIDSEND